MKKCFKMSGKYKTEHLFVPVFICFACVVGCVCDSFFVTVSAIVETNR